MSAKQRCTLEKIHQENIDVQLCLMRRWWLGSHNQENTLLQSTLSEIVYAPHHCPSELPNQLLLGSEGINVMATASIASWRSSRCAHQCRMSSWRLLNLHSKSILRGQNIIKMLMWVICIFPGNASASKRYPKNWTRAVSNPMLELWWLISLLKEQKRTLESHKKRLPASSLCLFPSASSSIP